MYGVVEVVVSTVTAEFRDLRSVVEAGDDTQRQVPHEVDDGEE